MVQRREVLSWQDVNELIAHLAPQFRTSFDAMLLITLGGIVPGGLLSEVVGVKLILTTSVEFPSVSGNMNQTRLLVWPNFSQFPETTLLAGKRILIVDDVWASGRTITSVKNRVTASGGEPFTCVLHFNPARNLFKNMQPDYYAAITDAYIVYPWEIDSNYAKGSLIDFDL